MTEPYGPRASIGVVGTAEPLPDGSWFVTGWGFDGRNDPNLYDHGCPFMHDEAGHHVGYLGWRWEELKAVSDARFDLARLETT